MHTFQVSDEARAINSLAVVQCTDLREEPANLGTGVFPDIESGEISEKPASNDNQ